MGLFDDVATLVRAERRILARSRRGLGPPSRPDFQAQRAGTHPQRRWGASLRSALGAVAIAAALLLSQNPAAAQFVCQDVVTGTGQGATATAGSLACGPGCAHPIWHQFSGTRRCDAGDRRRQHERWK